MRGLAVERVKDRLASRAEPCQYFDFTGVERGVARNANYSRQNIDGTSRDFATRDSRVKEDRRVFESEVRARRNIDQMFHHFCSISRSVEDTGKTGGSLLSDGSNFQN